MNAPHASLRQSKHRYIQYVFNQIYAKYEMLVQKAQVESSVDIFSIINILLSNVKLNFPNFLLPDANILSSWLQLLPANSVSASSPCFSVHFS
jgi:hypothetical protein